MLHVPQFVAHVLQVPQLVTQVKPLVIGWQTGTQVKPPPVGGHGHVLIVSGQPTQVKTHVLQVAESGSVKGGMLPQSGPHPVSGIVCGPPPPPVAVRRVPKRMSRSNSSAVPAEKVLVDVRTDLTLAPKRT